MLFPAGGKPPVPTPSRSVKARTDVGSTLRAELSAKDRPRRDTAVVGNRNGVKSGGVYKPAQSADRRTVKFIRQVRKRVTLVASHHIARLWPNQIDKIAIPVGGTKASLANRRE